MAAVLSTFLPKLTEYDPADTAEGSIDPLGLYPVSEALATRLAPGVRERQSRVRFLTTSAVSLNLCFGFGEDQIAADGVSEPWQVFEWYVVEGLVRRQGDEPLVGIPGQNKVGAAIQQGRPVSAATYLKAAGTFGFHGVYRVLARELGIEVGGLLGEAGSQLLEVWEQEQALGGFRTGHTDEALRWRDAIRDGLGEGAVARKGGWAGWQFVANHLHPSHVGLREARLLRNLLVRPSQGFRDRLIGSLVTSEVQDVWRETGSERAIHDLFLDSAPAAGEFRRLLCAIQTYESFARLLQNAWEDMLFAMTGSLRRVKPADLASEPGVVAAAKHAPRVYCELLPQLEALPQPVSIGASFDRFGEPLAAADFAEQLLLHHVEVQRAKPPHGKAPWCERFDDGSVFVRPAYRRKERAELDDRYVHGYRTRTLMTFLEDLRRVN